MIRPLRRLVLATAAFALIAACGGGGNPPPPPTPPQVFLTAPSANVIAPTLHVKVNVSGCQSVKQVSIQQQDKFIKAVDNPKVPVDIELTTGAFDTLYNSLGIAAGLTLKATAVCDDDRTNTSTGLGISFMPVASAIDPGAGMQTMLPDSFVVEGGLSGSQPSFIGCIEVNDMLAIAKVDTLGMATPFNTSLPFACSAASTITDKNNASGMRWLIDQGGAFSFDENMMINGGLDGHFPIAGVSPDGDLMVFTDQGSLGAQLFRIPAAGPPNNYVWQGNTHGNNISGGSSVIASPAWDNLGNVYLLTWLYDVASNSGALQVEKYNWTNGMPSGLNPLGTQSYGDLNTASVPGAAFSQDASTLFLAIMATGVSGHMTTQIVACSSLDPNCQPPNGVKWASPALDAIIIAVLPYHNDKIIAAVAPDRIFFLDGDDGHLLNWNGEPLIASGGLSVQQLQPGAGRDFYMLSGPNMGYPTEVVAVDSPEAGELWRFGVEGGTSPQTAITMGVDAAGQSWLRVGTTQVKPLSLPDYRNARGASP